MFDIMICSFITNQYSMYKTNWEVYNCFAIKLENNQKQRNNDMHILFKKCNGACVSKIEKAVT